VHSIIIFLKFVNSRDFTFARALPGYDDGLYDAPACESGEGSEYRRESKMGLAAREQPDYANRKQYRPKSERRHGTYFIK
jgi:hypothetical protein